MSNEFSIKINKYQLNHLFKNVRKLGGGKNLIARKLNISTPTLDEYLKLGSEFLNNFSEKLNPIYELDIDAIDDDIIKTKSMFVDKFLNQEDGNNYSVISDKNKNAFEVFFFNEKEKIKEDYIYKFQREIIENIKWSDNELENNKIIILMLFKLIYDRAQMSLDEELLYLKNKYAKTSSKHVAIVVKDLERRNREDFGDIKDTTEDKKQITVNQQFNNFTHYCIEHDKSLGLLKKNPDINMDNEDIIDIEPE